MKITRHPCTPIVSLCYGCENFGRLTRVMLHRPGKAFELINSENHKQWLFDRVPDIERFAEEHDRYREMLVSLGVEVLELSDHVTRNLALIDRMPNLIYLHDIAVISGRGAILSRMAWDARRDEQVVVREALNNLGIPVSSSSTIRTTPSRAAFCFRLRRCWWLRPRGTAFPPY